MSSLLDDLGRLIRWTHAQLRGIVAGLDEKALNWSPGEDMNSVAVLVTHMLGSEAEVLRLVRNLPSDRVRAKEFEAAADLEGLMVLIDQADALVTEHLAAITEDDLARTWTKPSAQRITTPQTGMFWLLNNYGHLREHIAHLEMTVQLYGDRF